MRVAVGRSDFEGDAHVYSAPAVHDDEAGLGILDLSIKLTTYNIIVRSCHTHAWRR